MFQNHHPLMKDQEPPLGAHLITPRLGFTHHGIYVGGGKVVHYGTLAHGFHRQPVEEVRIKRFADGHRVWMRIHENVLFEPMQIIERARSRVGEDRYGLFTNNCEHFCEWCLHGVSLSYQVQRMRILARTMTGLAAAAFCALVTRPAMFFF
jgi:hypothetical protein